MIVIYAIDENVSYKGKNYKLLWKGSTKYGNRAHLSFMDGSKDFWVDASAIGSPTGGTPREGYKSDQYNSGEYRITSGGQHLVKVNGPRGMYWKKADKWDKFDEFDN